MRVKPHRPRTPPKGPKTGEYWIVEWNGHREVMKVSPVMVLSWQRCGDYSDISRGVTPIKRIRIK